MVVTGKMLEREADKVSVWKNDCCVARGETQACPLGYAIHVPKLDRPTPASEVAHIEHVYI